MEGGRWLSSLSPPPRSPAVAPREYVCEEATSSSSSSSHGHLLCLLPFDGRGGGGGGGGGGRGGPLGWSAGCKCTGLFGGGGSEWRQLGWLPFLLLLLCRWVRGSVCCGDGARRRECKEWRLSSSSSFRPWRRRTAERRRTEDGGGGEGSWESENIGTRKKTAGLRRRGTLSLSK